MRKRILSPGFFQSEELGACSPRARLLFAGLWLLADREGRLRWNPLVVHGQLFPFEPEADVPKAAEELTAHGLVECYEVGGRKYMQIPSWGEHQRPHPKEAASKIPSMVQASFKHDSSRKEAWPGVAPKHESSTYGSNPPESDTVSDTDTESVSFARERDSDSGDGGRIDTAGIREALGMPIFVPPAAQPKWAGISKQDPAEVQALVTWASGTDRPGKAFMGCFDSNGKIRTKKPAARNGRPPGETDDERWARLAREYGN